MRVLALLVAALVIALPSGVRAQTVIVDVTPHTDELLFATYRGDVRTMTKRLNAGVDINIRDVLGMTLLMLAAERQHAAAVRLLLSRGAEVGFADEQGHDAYWYATHRRVWASLPVIGRFYIPLPRLTATESATLIQAAKERRLAARR